MLDEKTLLWIEKFYSDFEGGMRQVGKTYTRPNDYIERALTVLNGNRKPFNSGDKNAQPNMRIYRKNGE